MSPFPLLVLGLLTATPDPIVVAPPPPVAGLVVDEEDRPVADAEVFLVSSLAIVEPSGPLWQGRTDAEGRFVAECGPAVAVSPLLTAVLVYRAGCRPAGVPVDLLNRTRPEEPVRLVLRPARGVPVRVVGPGGEPVAGARVGVSSFDAVLGLPAALGERLAATTGADGRAVIAAFSPGDFLACKVEAPGFGSQSFALDRRADGAQALTLRPAGRLSGRVVADDPEQARGLALRGTITAGLTRADSTTVGGFEATTGADGRFEVPALPAGWLMFVGGQARSGHVLRRVPETTVEAGRRAVVELALKRGFPVRGAVRERETGRPIAGAWLAVTSSPDGGSVHVQSDAGGRFSAALLPGRIRGSPAYTVPYVIPTDVPPGTSTLAEGADALELPPLDLVRGVEVRGFVRDEANAPAAGATVEAVRDLPRGVDLYPRRFLVTADGRGEFVFRAVEPGVRLELTAWHGETASGPPAPLVADARAAPALLVVAARHTRSLGGRVVDEDGNPVAGAKVVVRSRKTTAAGGELVGSELPFLHGNMDWDLVTDAAGRFQTPRQLLMYEEHQARARADGRMKAETVWLAPTTPSFFDLVLTEPPPADQAGVREHISVAELARAEGNPGQAETLYEQAVALAEAQGMAGKHPRTFARLLSRLARLKQEAGKLPEAEAEARSALAALEKAPGPGPSDMADTLSQLAFLCKLQGKSVEAEALFRRAMAVRERAQGADHPLYARDQSEAAGLVFRDISRNVLRYGDQLVRLAAVEVELNHAVAVIEASLGRDHDELANPLWLRGNVRHLLGRFPEAESDYRRALPITERVYGADQPVTASALDVLANLLRLTGRPTEAEPLEARARQIRGR